MKKYKLLLKKLNQKILKNSKEIIKNAEQLKIHKNGYYEGYSNCAEVYNLCEEQLELITRRNHLAGDIKSLEIWDKNENCKVI
jgi:hypothetical protein